MCWKFWIWVSFSTLVCSHLGPHCPLSSRSKCRRCSVLASHSTLVLDSKIITLSDWTWPSVRKVRCESAASGLTLEMVMALWFITVRWLFSVEIDIICLSMTCSLLICHQSSTVRVSNSLETIVVKNWTHLACQKLESKICQNPKPYSRHKKKRIMKQTF